jgi:hypothetical protein
MLIIGFNIGVRGRSSYVVCSAATKKVHQSEPGRKEWVTVVECICGDGTALSPLVIFKGENIQTAWIPSEMDNNWSWACNTKGWTCNAIGEEWIRRCFEPATREKADGAVRLLVADGHGSHVTAPFIRFCIDNNILVLLLPPHSSHLTQPLDVGIFSPLKLRMAEELDRILRYGVNDLKKFEWANCYRIARPLGMSPSNIESAWSGAGLIPFAPQKVLRRVKTKYTEQEIEQLTTPENDPTLPLSPRSTFNSVPDTPSHLDSTIFRSANQTLLNKIQASNLDSPTRSYASKLISLSEHLRASNILIKHHHEELSAIVKKRKVMAQGKRVALKDQVLVTTEELYAKVKAAEEATKSRTRTSGRGRGRGRPRATQINRNDVQDTQEEHSIASVAVIDTVMP